MKTRILVGVICVPLLFLALVLLPAFCTGVVTGVIAAACMWELRRSLGISKSFSDYLCAALILLLHVLCTFDVSPAFGTAVLFILLAASFCEFLRRYEKGQDAPPAQVFGSVFAVAVIPYALSSVASLRMLGGEMGRAYVLLPFLVAFITDAGAYFTGVFLGKTRAFPRISPKKTVAGVVGGVISGVIVVFAFWLVLMQIHDGLSLPVVSLTLLGLAGAGATIFGDLVFSLIKRVAGIKDYGNILPGHGGMLDRFDSLIIAAPVVYLLVTALLPTGA